MTAHQSGVHLDKVPLRSCGFQHIHRVNAHQGEYLRQLVNKGNVDVALAVLNNLGGLGHLDTRSLVRAIGKHRAVHFVDKLCYLGGGAGGNLSDFLHRVHLVAGVDTLGRIADFEINAAL